MTKIPLDFTICNLFIGIAQRDSLETVYSQEILVIEFVVLNIKLSDIIIVANTRRDYLENISMVIDRLNHLKLPKREKFP